MAGKFSLLSALLFNYDKASPYKRIKQSRRGAFCCILDLYKPSLFHVQISSAFHYILHPYSTGFLLYLKTTWHLVLDIHHLCNCTSLLNERKQANEYVVDVRICLPYYTHISRILKIVVSYHKLQSRAWLELLQFMLSITRWFLHCVYVSAMCAVRALKVKCLCDLKRCRLCH